VKELLYSYYWFVCAVGKKGKEDGGCYARLDWSFFFFTPRDEEEAEEKEGEEEEGA